MDVNFEGDLNSEQLAAATAGDGPMLILAAAGTGKTRTLVYRVAYLVSLGIEPDRILLLTFTNRAAKEMLERASQLVRNPAGIPWSGTFHHIANRLLRRHSSLLGYASGYTILDQDDSRKLMSDAIKELGLKSKEFPKREVLLHVLSQARNRQLPLDDAVEDHFDGFEVDPAPVLAAIQRYEKRKVELGAMDFDDLLVNCLRLLNEHPEVRQRYARQFQHVLVDEYQDTNTIQSQLVDALSSEFHNLFVVGDDFQSIYGWRGADTRNILEFRKRYPSAQIYKLETNYRSVPEVLNLANVTVGCSDHPEEYRKTLRATREPYRCPTVARLRDGDHQARYVVELLRNFRRDGYRPRDIVILYRAHYHAMELQMALTRARIQHNITSGMRFFEQAHVKDVLALLRVLSSATDALAFERLLCLLPSVGEVTVRKLWIKMGERFDAADAVARTTLAEALRPAARARWAAIVPVIEAYYRSGLSVNGGEVVQRFLDAFYASYAAATFDNPESRVDDIRELSLHFGRFENVEQCLSDIALLTNLDAEADAAGNADAESIRLSTVHQAKGLEWPVVIILWMTEGMFPSQRSLNESGDGDAEERRLFYVAATRAKDELVLCVPEVRRSRDGGVFYCNPSRYIEELPATVAQTRRISYVG
jgi:DNA helicase-2/ATP-dependent DNA helicase PcrA